MQEILQHISLVRSCGLPDGTAPREGLQQNRASSHTSVRGCRRAADGTVAFVIE